MRHVLLPALLLPLSFCWALASKAAETYVSPEPGLLKNYPKQFQRDEATLTIQLNAGQSKRYSNKEETSPSQNDSHTCWLDAYYPKAAYVLVRCSYWLGEGQAYILVSLKTGAENEVSGAPTISPDSTRFAVSMSDIEAVFQENRLAIYRIDQHALVREFEVTPKDWGASKPHWQNNGHLSFNKEYWNGTRTIAEQKHLKGSGTPVRWAIH